jgi:hypothetical protein
MTTEASRRRVFFFVHIPKCAGSTLNAIMRRNFREGYWEEYRLLEPRALRYRSDDLSKLIDFIPHLRFFAGHCISTDLPYGRTDLEVIAIASVRDPVERILSWYSYNRNSHRYAQVEKRQELGTYLENAIRSYDYVSDPWRWCQVPDLVDEHGEKGLSRIRDLAARDRLFLFPLRRFDEMMVFLERTWPEDFADCAYPGRENESRYDQPVTSEIQRQKEELGTLPPVAIDRRLVELAGSELTRRIAALPGGASQFADRMREFEARCERARARERIRAPLRRARNLLRRMLC